MSYSVKCIQLNYSINSSSSSLSSSQYDLQVYFDFQKSSKFVIEKNNL